MSPQKRRTWYLALAAGWFMLVPPAWNTRAETAAPLPLPTLVVARATGAVTVDGTLDEPAWRNAVSITRLQDWNDGHVVQPDTKVLLCWTDTHIFVAWDCSEPHMDKLVARPDGNVWSDDDVEIFFQRPKHLDYGHFMVNALGRVQSESSLGDTYRTNARAAATRRADGWTVELAIPWKDLGGPPVPGVPWRVNVNRVRKPAPPSFGCWAVTQGSFHHASRFGFMRFEETAPCRVTEVSPGALALGANRAVFSGVGGKTGRAEAAILLDKRVLARCPVVPGKPWKLEAPYTVDPESGDALIFQVIAERDTPIFSRAFPLLFPGKEDLAALRRALDNARRWAAREEVSDAVRTGLQKRIATAKDLEEEGRAQIRRAIDAGTVVDPQAWNTFLARIRRATRAFSRPVLWSRNPFCITRPDSLPDVLPEQVEVRIQTFRNEREIGSLLIANVFGGQHLELRATLGAMERVPGTSNTAESEEEIHTLNRDRIVLAEAMMIRTAHGGRLADPIVPLDRAGRLQIPPGETRELWLTVATDENTPPGLYRGTLALRPTDPLLCRWIMTVPVAVRIWPVKLPATNHRVFNFDYYRGGGSDIWFRDLRDHRVNVFALKAPVPNDQGVADFSPLDEPIERVKGHGLIFFESWFFRSKGWQPQHARWIHDLVATMERHGLTYDDWVLHIFDETLSDRFLETARAIKKVDPKLQLFSDRMGPPERLESFAPVLDYWCPFYRDLTKPGMQVMRRSGHPIWTYDCGSGKHIAPSHNRALPWCAWHYRLEGVCYWTYFSSYGDTWNDLDQGHQDWSKVYDDVRGLPLSSKRWEAWREGLEDWALFDLYARSLKPGGKQAAEDAALLADMHAVGTAADAPPETLARIVDGVRRRILLRQGLKEQSFPPNCDIAWHRRLAGDGRGRILRLSAEADGPPQQIGAGLHSPGARSWTFLVQPLDVSPGARAILRLRVRGKGHFKAGICEGYHWGENGAGHRTTCRIVPLEAKWKKLEIVHVVGRQQPVEALLGFDYNNAGATAEVRDYRVEILPAASQ